MLRGWTEPSSRGLIHSQTYVFTSVAAARPQVHPVAGRRRRRCCTAPAPSAGHPHRPDRAVGPPRRRRTSPAGALTFESASAALIAAASRSTKVSSRVGVRRAAREWTVTSGSSRSPASIRPAEPVLVLLEGAHAGGHPLAAGAGGAGHAREEVDGRRRPSHQFVRQRAQFEALGYLVGGGQQLGGPKVGEHVAPACDHAAVWTKELVGRAREEVGAQLADVDHPVCGVVHAVDVQQCSHGVHAFGDGAHVRHRCRSGSMRRSPRRRASDRSAGPRRSPRTARRSTGSKSTHRTTAPAAAAASTHGRTLASWSSRVTTTSSPGRQCDDRVRDRSKVRAVMLRPKITSSGSTLSRSAMALRHSTTISSALRAAAVVLPRLDIGRSIASRMASATAVGVCEPPGPSKKAVPASSAGKHPRIASTSKPDLSVALSSGSVTGQVSH